MPREPLRVASFLPFQTTYYLNGHSFIEQELNRAQIGLRKNDNAFLAVDDVAALQAVHGYSRPRSCAPCTMETTVTSRRSWLARIAAADRARCISCADEQDKAPSSSDFWSPG